MYGVHTSNRGRRVCVEANRARRTPADGERRRKPGGAVRGGRGACGRGARGALGRGRSGRRGHGPRPLAHRNPPGGRGRHPGGGGRRRRRAPRPRRVGARGGDGVAGEGGQLAARRWGDAAREDLGDLGGEEGGRKRGRWARAGRPVGDDWPVDEILTSWLRLASCHQDLDGWRWTLWGGEWAMPGGRGLRWPRGAAGAKYHITWLCTVTGPTVHQLGPVAEWSVFLTGLVRSSVRCRPRAFFFFLPASRSHLWPWFFDMSYNLGVSNYPWCGRVICITAGGDWVIPQGRSGDIYILQWVGAPLPPRPPVRYTYCSVVYAMHLIKEIGNGGKRGAIPPGGPWGVVAIRRGGPLGVRRFRRGVFGGVVAVRRRGARRAADTAQATAIESCDLKTNLTKSARTGVWDL